MLSELTPSQRSALERVIKNPELQPAFFELVEGPIWFDALYEKGLLKPNLLPPPIEVKPGQFQIPNWPITDFLLEFSKFVKEEAEDTYAEKLWAVLVDVTHYAKEHDFGNYRVWWQFSKIASNLPLEILRENFHENVIFWLRDDFGGKLVGDQIVAWLDNLLDSESEYSNEVAQSLLTLIYGIIFEEKQYFKDGKLEARLLLKSYKFREKKKALAKKIGSVLGLNAISVFISTIEEILRVEENDKWSCTWRPAIEDHAQNHTVDDAQNVLVEAIRDSYCEYLGELDTKDLSLPILSILESKYETIGRIGIYLSNYYFEKLNENALSLIISDRYFHDNFRHELWHFLNSHYASLPDNLKKKTISIILSLKGRRDDDEDEKVLIGRTAYRRALWLSSFSNASKQAEILYRKCLEIIKKEPDHPDFASYMTSGSVVHDSPNTVEEIEELSAYPEVLVEYLNDYRYQGHFNEPGLEGLVNTFAGFVRNNPTKVSEMFQELKNLKTYYIHEIFKGYLDLWEKSSELDWDSLWPKLLTFSHDLVKTKEFWTSNQDAPGGAFIGNRDWTIGTLSRLIEAGCKNSGHSFDESNTILANQVLEMILAHQSGAVFEDDSDAVSIAINSPRGRCLEAYINLALFDARNNDNNPEVTVKYFATFDKELHKSDGDHPEYEFATLVANYFPNFMYLSEKWALKNVPIIFDIHNKKKWLCAVQGFSYVPQFVPQIYQYLKDNGHLIAILDTEGLKDRLDNRYIQLIGIAYYRQIEKIEAENNTLLTLIQRNDTKELGQLIWFIWTLRGPETFERAKGMVYELFPLILQIADLNEELGQKLASQLCHWTIFIDDLDELSLKWLKCIAPYAQVNYNATHLIEGMAKLSKDYPIEVGNIWKEMLNGEACDFPPEEIKQILSNLVKAGKEGALAAKEIVSLYYKQGLHNPNNWLKELVEH